jgi:hypothetical protein
MADRRRHPGWAVAVILAGLLAGCAGSPTIIEKPASSTQPSTAPGPTTTPATPTPATSQPPPEAPGPSEPPGGSLKSSASTEREGVRIEIALATNPMRAGNKMLLTTTIKNTGTDTLNWNVNGCGVNTYVTGVSDATWRPGPGTTDPLLKGHAEFLRSEVDLDTLIRLRFEPGWLSGSVEEGCADLAIRRSLKPGASRSQELVWNGQAASLLGPPPSSPVEIEATFDYWWRGSETDNNADRPEKPIVVTLDSWVVKGPEPAFLSPGEAIDAALADPVFGAWAVNQPFNDRRVGVVQYDPAADVWIVGLIHDMDYGPSFLHAALIDPLTGVVVAIRDIEAYR